LLSHSLRGSTWLRADAYGIESDTLGAIHHIIFVTTAIIIMTRGGGPKTAVRRAPNPPPKDLRPRMHTTTTSSLFATRNPYSPAYVWLQVRWLGAVLEVSASRRRHSSAARGRQGAMCPVPRQELSRRRCALSTTRNVLQ